MTDRHPEGNLPSRYPDHGQVPNQLHMSACEVLCWIGYGRAIPKAVYFAPFVASNLRPDQWGSQAHDDIPSPKPRADPMEQAERDLMAAMRQGRVVAYHDRPSCYEEVAAAVYEYAVAVNVRGSIEADTHADNRDAMKADAFLNSRPPIGDVAFRTGDVLAVWPRGWPDDGAISKPRPIRPTRSAVENWLQERVANWPDEEPAPSERDDWNAAKEVFGDGMTRRDFRPMREDSVPDGWKVQGRRKPWGLVKKSAANLAIRPTADIDGRI